MPTIIKELPSRDWLLEHYCLIDNYVCWKEKTMSRGRSSVRANRRITNYLDDCGYVRVAIKGKTYQSGRIVYQMIHGDLTHEFEVDHIDNNKQNNSPGNLRKVIQGINKRNKPKQKNQATMDTGVCLCRKKHPLPHQDKITEYYVARWYDLTGKPQSKSFRIDTHGEEMAYNLAVVHRKLMIQELNSRGAGYTENHGI